MSEAELLENNEIDGDVNFESPVPASPTRAAMAGASPLRTSQAGESPVRRAPGPATPTSTPLGSPLLRADQQAARHQGVLELENKVAQLWGRFDQLGRDMDVVLHEARAFE